LRGLADGEGEAGGGDQVPAPRPRSTAVLPPDRASD
jgi:hypothetical protein